MRALQERNSFQRDDNDVNIQLKIHRNKIKHAKPFVDNNIPNSILIKEQIKSVKSNISKQDKDKDINKQNFDLAKRLFDIMDKPGIISDVFNDRKHIERHPLTMNFKSRLNEAKSIVKENMIIANRLNSIQPYYKLDIPNNNKINVKPKNNKKIISNDKMIDVNIDREINSNILEFEYTKIQSGRILDIAVIKEPFVDNYIIFGIDIENGNKYELSIEIKNICDILNIDISSNEFDYNITQRMWMKLLNLIELPATNISVPIANLDNQLDAIETVKNILHITEHPPVLTNKKSYNYKRRKNKKINNNEANIDVVVTKNTTDNITNSNITNNKIESVDIVKTSTLTPSKPKSPPKPTRVSIRKLSNNRASNNNKGDNINIIKIVNKKKDKKLTIDTSDEMVLTANNSINEFIPIFYEEFEKIHLDEHNDEYFDNDIEINDICTEVINEIIEKIINSSDK